jgi:hypothetical protein
MLYLLPQQILLVLNSFEQGVDLIQVRRRLDFVVEVVLDSGRDTSAPLSQLRHADRSGRNGVTGDRSREHLEDIEKCLYDSRFLQKFPSGASSSRRRGRKVDEVTESTKAHSIERRTVVPVLSLL